MVNRTETLGLILNIPTSGACGLCKGRHWVCVRQLNSRLPPREDDANRFWYLLDSKEKQPQFLGNTDSMVTQMYDILASNSEILVIEEAKNSQSDSSAPQPSTSKV